MAKKKRGGKESRQKKRGQEKKRAIQPIKPTIKPIMADAKIDDKIKKLLFFEVGRKGTHIIFGSIILILIFYDLIWLQGLAILIAAALVASIFSKRYKIPLVYFMLKNFERPENLLRFPGRGLVYFLLGILISLILFPKSIALASIAILTFGDAVASFFNITHGKTEHPLAVNKRKLLEGTLAGTIVGFLASVLFVEWKLALAGSIVGMIFEAMEIKINGEAIDDNVIVPVTAGTAMMIFLYLF